MISLLALSGGALALPQTGEAGIFYSGPLNVTVGFGAGSQSFWSGALGPAGSAGLLLGAIPAPSAHLVFLEVVPRGSGSSSAGGSVKAHYHSGVPFLRLANAGQTWHEIRRAHATSFGALVAARISSSAYPSSFSDRYAAFRFRDTGTGGNWWYGWAELSLDNSSLNGPDVTIKGFAYDENGDPIQMGAVPDSGPTGVLAAIGAALVLGADGVRRWRAQKQASALST